ncbi:MAG TPA: hypothetical protein VIH28_07015 [Ignavibacteriaceae bacterium]
METATYNNVKYKIEKDDYSKIKVGNLAYSPYMKAIVSISYEDDLKYVNDNYYKVKPLIGLERYPEFKEVVAKIASQVCKEIKKEAKNVDSEMPYKEQFILEELIQNLQDRV